MLRATASAATSFSSSPDVLTAPLRARLTSVVFSPNARGAASLAPVIAPEPRATASSSSSPPQLLSALASAEPPTLSGVHAGATSIILHFCSIFVSRQAMFFAGTLVALYWIVSYGLRAAVAAFMRLLVRAPLQQRLALPGQGLPVQGQLVPAVHGQPLVNPAVRQHIISPDAAAITVYYVLEPARGANACKALQVMNENLWHVVRAEDRAYQVGLQQEFPSVSQVAHLAALGGVTNLKGALVTNLTVGGAIRDVLAVLGGDYAKDFKPVKRPRTVAEKTQAVHAGDDPSSRIRAYPFFNP
jgi:hypothetical protein